MVVASVIEVEDTVPDVARPAGEATPIIHIETEIAIKTRHAVNLIGGASIKIPVVHLSLLITIATVKASHLKQGKDKQRYPRYPLAQETTNS